MNTPSDAHLFALGFIFLNLGLLAYFTGNGIWAFALLIASLVAFTRLFSHALKGGEQNGEGSLDSVGSSSSINSSDGNISN